ncbi:hypothetical protein GH5_04460 [Leishmania sp. Ghana 2012 LV757]|uniref:hypothetical protein n=1 Tax=Leishmania sp. Ghana 2012 LV757 TaxID=2803181 RepID=UPI001B75498D|nr:hypothetical protein GH5_04460 [Leishmania sp. Ghana 2012 LV757]
MPPSRDGKSRAFRYGAPAAVVDPLLSFLFDLRRMEDSVLSALEHLGVEHRHLPHPFGSGPSASPPQTSATADNAAAAPPGAPLLSIPASDPIEVYAYEVTASHPGAGDASVEGVVYQLLNWLASQLSSPSSTPAPSQQLLTLFAAASVAGADVFVRDAVTHEVSRVGPPRQEGQSDRSAAPASLDADTLVRGDDSTAHLVGALTAADIHAAVQLWREYERLLKSGVAEMKATLAAVTAARPGNSHSCHAKWIEHTRSDAKVKCVVPASTVLKRNYEERIRLNDALATCQAAVHTAYVALEENLDVFLEEAQTVDRQERLFQHHVSAALSECAALHALRTRIKQARRALERCIHGQRGTAKVQLR